MDIDIRPEDADYCLDIVRQKANDLYLADLLLPQDIRTDIVVLHAFHAEITSATLSFSDPMVTQIRLQWWTDVLAGKRNEEAAGNPLSRALLAVINKHDLPVQSLNAKIEAHVFDLYNDPMTDRNMLEGYCGETRSVLFHMAATLCGVENNTKLADASGHAGVAMGITGSLNQLVWHHGTGRVFVPADILSNHGLDAAGFLSTPTQAHSDVVLEMVTLARHHLERAMAAIDALPKEHRRLFNSLALVPNYLGKMEKEPGGLFKQPVVLSQLKRQWSLWRF